MAGWDVPEELTVGAIDIRLLAGSALRALKGAGTSERTLRVYECTGFGELCRRFEARGVSEYSPELADAVVREVWSDFQRGVFSSWKWTAVRRGAALLDVFARTGSWISRRCRRGLRCGCRRRRSNSLSRATCTL
jgi:hypothetical protein